MNSRQFGIYWQSGTVCFKLRLQQQTLRMRIMWLLNKFRMCRRPSHPSWLCDPLAAGLRSYSPVVSNLICLDHVAPWRIECRLLTLLGRPVVDVVVPRCSACVVLSWQGTRCVRIGLHLRTSHSSSAWSPANGYTCMALSPRRRMLKSALRVLGCCSRVIGDMLDLPSDQWLKRLTTIILSDYLLILLLLLLCTVKLVQYSSLVC